ncbi:MAG: YCF48-related protein [bacterium]|nr:YCF48-related protein [bacterium]
MKKVFVVLTLFVFPSLINSQWTIRPSGTPNHLQSVFFINESTGWVCGFETILKTTDCGTSWSEQFINGFLRSVYFTDENTGWVCGDNGKLFRTTDGGTTWLLKNLNITSGLNKIIFQDQNTGLLAGNNRTILKTTNGGGNWMSMIGSYNFQNLYSSIIIEPDTYLCSGNESTIYKSTNAGISWDSISFNMPNPLFAVEFINLNTGFVTGCCGMFLKTTDSGLNWSAEAFLTPGYSVHSLKFYDSNTGWLAGDAGYVMRTTDSGDRWDSLNSGVSQDLYSVTFVNNDTGFVVGNNGTILKTTNGGGPGYSVSVNNSNTLVADKFYLSQNYPNPFNPNTIINYELKVTNYVTLKIFDINGKEVSTPVNQNQVAGNYAVTFDGSNFPSGVYFYDLTAGEFSEVKRMVLLK